MLWETKGKGVTFLQHSLHCGGLAICNIGTLQ